MCGIAGISANPAENLPIKDVVKDLLLGIEPRGRDATGYAVWNPAEGKILSDKAPMPAKQFVTSDQFVITPTDRNVILHTRFATQGSPANHLNNHPIAVNNAQIVGVHNGCLSNDDTLFATLNAPRIAQVDSEAIFAALAYGTSKDDRYPNLAAGHTIDVLASIEGSAAVAWFDRSDKTGTMHISRISSSPLHVAQTAGGSLIFASTPDAISAALQGRAEIKTMLNVPTGTYLTVESGQITSETSFTPATVTAYVPTPTDTTSAPTAIQNAPRVTPQTPRYLPVPHATPVATTTKPIPSTRTFTYKFDDTRTITLDVPADLHVSDMIKARTAIDQFLTNVACNALDARLEALT